MSLVTFHWMEQIKGIGGAKGEHFPFCQVDATWAGMEYKDKTIKLIYRSLPLHKIQVKSIVSYQFKQKSEFEWPVGFAEWQQGEGIVLSHSFCTHEVKYMFEGDTVLSFLGDTQKLFGHNLG